MKKIDILLISNQHPNKEGIGNPIMLRMKDALQADDRIGNLSFLPFENKLSSLFKVRKASKATDITHIHFGGLYALIIWVFLLGIKRVKIITFHGTDIHGKSIKTAKGFLKKVKIRINQYSSFLSIILFDRVGFVSEEMMNYIPSILKSVLRKKAFIQQLGVDYKLFSTMDKRQAQQHLGLCEKKYILFSDISNTTIKRRDLAEKIASMMGENYQLLIMCGIAPSVVPYYINACDFLLLTSDEEGSPNIIRECLALNKPIFSVDVGDARQQLLNLSNSKIISRDPQKAVETIKEVLNRPYIDNTRTTLEKKISFYETNKAVVELYLQQMEK